MFLHGVASFLRYLEKRRWYRTRLRVPLLRAGDQYFGNYSHSPSIRAGNLVSPVQWSAVLFAIVIGLLMAFFYRQEEKEKTKTAMNLPEQEERRNPSQNLLFFIVLIFILIFAAWGKPEGAALAFWVLVFSIKWYFVLNPIGNPGVYPDALV
jgi:multisubunit Na+/H+ antiporter MnhC subunit